MVAQQSSHENSSNSVYSNSNIVASYNLGFPEFTRIMHVSCRKKGFHEFTVMTFVSDQKEASPCVDFDDVCIL